MPEPSVHGSPHHDAPVLRYFLVPGRLVPPTPAVALSSYRHPIPAVGWGGHGSGAGIGEATRVRLDWPRHYPEDVGASLRQWTGRRRSAGFLGGLLFLLLTLAVLVVLAFLAALGLLLMALVGAVMAGERLLGLLVPAYRRRRREPYLTMPTVLVRTVRFGSGPTQVIEAHSVELPRRED